MADLSRIANVIIWLKSRGRPTPTPVAAGTPIEAGTPIGAGSTNSSGT